MRAFLYIIFAKRKGNVLIDIKIRMVKMFEPVEVYEKPYKPSIADIFNLFALKKEYLIIELKKIAFLTF